MSNSKNSKRILLDSVHGTISFEPLIFRIIDTPEFQRLRNIKQLESITYIFPSANHSRFEHSIGTCYLAGLFIEHLKKEQADLMIDDKDVLCVKIAALCHDVGHGPYSHLFEDIIRRIYLEKYPTKNYQDAKQFFQHEKASLLIVDRIFEKLGSSKEFTDAGLNLKDRDFIKELIKPELIQEIEKSYCLMNERKTKAEIKSDQDRINELDVKLQNRCGRSQEKSFLFEIVSNFRNQIDVDKWDYFARDSLNLGIKITFDFKRYIAGSRVIKPTDRGLNQICLREKELRNVYEMFRTREDLHRRAYQNPKVVGIKEMIIDAFILLDNVVNFYAIGENLESKLDDYIGLDDQILSITSRFCTSLLSTSLDANKLKSMEKSREILQKLHTRQIYKMMRKQMINNTPKITRKEAQEQIKQAMNNNVEDSDFIITEQRINFGNGNRDPLENLQFYEKNTNNPVDKKDIPDYNSCMKPQNFEEVSWSLYLKNENISDESRIIMIQKFDEICGIKVDESPTKRKQNASTSNGKAKSRKP